MYYSNKNSENVASNKALFHSLWSGVLCNNNKQTISILPVIDSFLTSVVKTDYEFLLLVHFHCIFILLDHSIIVLCFLYAFLFYIFNFCIIKNFELPFDK